MLWRTNRTVAKVGSRRHAGVRPRRQHARRLLAVAADRPLAGKRALVKGDYAEDGDIANWDGPPLSALYRAMRPLDEREPWCPDTARAHTRAIEVAADQGSWPAIGPGKAALLEASGETGSIAAAGRRMGMSYRRAWVLAKTMNACFRDPLIKTAKGGIGGGGARLTVMGREVLTLYRAMEDRGGRLCLDRFSRLISGASAGCRRGVPFSGWHAGRA
jgi:molybdate transport system regulatory protein